MRTSIPLLLGFALAAGFGSGGRAEEVRTVSDWAEAMSADAVKLEAAVTERQKAGDMAAAQRLVLSSAMIKRAADEFRAAEQDKLTDPLSALPAPLPARAAEALAIADKAAAGVTPAADFIANQHRVANALLAALPMVKPHPVFYGLLSRDLETAALPADVVVYGFRLTDPVLDAKPTVSFDRRELAARVVDDERLDITLPDDVKQTVGFAPGPCENRPSFGLRIRDSYAERKGFWPFRWHEEVVTHADLFALPTPIFYTAQITLSLEDEHEVATHATFQQNSDLAGADCEKTRAVEVSAALPPGAQNVTCTSDWLSLSGAARSANRCVVADGVARATGELTGGPRICSPENLCTCANAAQGFLQIKGGYDIAAPGPRLETNVAPAPLTLVAGGLAEFLIALAPRQKLRHVAVDLSQRACRKVSDRIDVTLTDEGQAEAQGVSKTGAFRAMLSGNLLRVGGAANFTAEAGRTP